MQDLNREERARRAGLRVRRYSRLVALMKVALPLGALALIAAIFLSARDHGDLAEIFTPEELAQLGAGLRLDNPRFAGITDKGEPFVVHSDWALPDSAMPRIIELEKPRGEIELNDGRTVSAVAKTGQLDREAETATLSGDVSIRTSDGYRFRTDRVRVDFRARTANAPVPVTASGPHGQIEAGSMRAASGPSGIADGKIWFENRVRLVFIPPKSEKSTAK